MIRLRNNVFVRKGVALCLQLPRHLCAARCSADDLRTRPPVLCNSVPKSGTHLLLQVLATLPGTRRFGTFLASQPTLTYREIPAEKLVRKANRLVSGELAAGHLFHDEQTAQALSRRRAVHYLVYRDPRDVAVSEALYLATMNRWHRLHPTFRDLPSDEARITFSIRGARDPDFPYSYPDIASRYRRYMGWMQREDVMAIRFEDLIGSRQRQTLGEIIEFYIERSGRSLDRSQLVEEGLAAIDPQKSHTFREGKAGGWNDRFTFELRQEFDRVAGDLLVELGYESDHCWAAA